MWQRRLGLVGIAAFVMAVAAPQPAQAMFISDPFGFSFFGVPVIDQVNHTISVTETIDSLVAGFTLNFEGPRGQLLDDRTFAWQITKIITDGTGNTWTNFDNEVKVPNPTGGGFISSNDFDGTSFDQGNLSRVINSDAFSWALVDELQNRDFLQFIGSCTPSGTTTCIDVGAASNSIAPSGSDTQTFPVVSFSISTVQLVQTPNFQNPENPTIPEPTSMLLFGLGSLGAGWFRRRKLCNV